MTSTAEPIGTSAHLLAIPETLTASEPVAAPPIAELPGLGCRILLSRKNADLRELV